MTDFFLPFLIGYTSAKILSYLLNSSAETAIKEDSVLLKWDKNIFGWRTATKINNEKVPGEKYMVAYPVSNQLIDLIKTKNNEKTGSAR